MPVGLCERIGNKDGNEQEFIWYLGSGTYAGWITLCYSVRGVTASGADECSCDKNPLQQAG